MTTIELMQRVVDYIEENLKTDLNLSELSAIAGFSTYHLCHLFNDVVGMPVAAFITKRRLNHAIYHMKKGKKLIDTALMYGFDTHAGFFKAFKREFGCSPTKFLKLNAAKKPVAVNLKREAKFMLTQTQIRKILKQWDIGSDYDIGSFLVAGGKFEANDTWHIGEDYVLKTGKNFSGLKTHIKVSRALEKNGMVAACPTKTNEGEDYITEDDRYYVLTKRIKGGFLTPEQRYRGDRVATGRKYGEAIGKLHKILKKQDDSLDVNEGNLLDRVLKWALPETKRIMEQWGYPLPEIFYESYIENFGKLYPKLPRHIIHRDSNPSNIMFYNDEVSGFIEFVVSERNIRLYDPCYCATGILSEADRIEDGFSKWGELLKGIVEGYDKVCKLTDSEVESIPYVIYSIQMICVAWLEDKEAHKSSALLNKKMLLWIWENRHNCFKMF